MHYTTRTFESNEYFIVWRRFRKYRRNLLAQSFCLRSVNVPLKGQHEYPGLTFWVSALLAFRQRFGLLFRRFLICLSDLLVAFCACFGSVLVLDYLSNGVDVSLISLIDRANLDIAFFLTASTLVGRGEQKQAHDNDDCDNDQLGAKEPQLIDKFQRTSPQFVFL